MAQQIEFRYRGRQNSWLVKVMGVLLLAGAAHSVAAPFAEPGDLRLRADLHLLSSQMPDGIPLTTWPLSWADILHAVENVDATALRPAELQALGRVVDAARKARRESTIDTTFALAAAVQPRVIRSFSATPRDEGEVAATLGWQGSRSALNVRLSGAVNPADGDETRVDGTYGSLAIGNWAVSAGWQERWWGPGHGGSLVLSNNARPVPALSVQRIRSKAFESRWLAWVGPWTMSAFAAKLDDDRAVHGAQLIGLRAAFRPVTGLEIALSRTAQWCGKGRPCSFSTFADLLIGNDNQGVNVDASDEPGNQLGGIDVRWSVPGKTPVDVYAQWIAEDTRRGGPEIGSFLRLAGVEYRAQMSGAAVHSYLEVAETSCRDGGLGFSELDADCGYEHGVYTSGYRYRGRSLGHGIDSDGLSYSLGSTLIQSGGETWQILVRHMKINRAGALTAGHTLSALPQIRSDIQVAHNRRYTFGEVDIGLGYSRIRGESAVQHGNDVTGYIRWTWQ